jgi:hypothetical protein
MPFKEARSLLKVFNVHINLPGPAVGVGAVVGNPNPGIEGMLSRRSPPPTRSVQTINDK